MAQGCYGGRVPSRFRDRTIRVAAHLEFAFPESACGIDDRVLVSNTTQVPWRCICQLIVEGLHGAQILGTGWLAGPHTIITAGHNLYSTIQGTVASQIWIFPGRNDDAVPFGFFTTDHFEVHPRWQESGDPMFDYGAVFLDQPLGNQIGWFGYSALSDPALNRLLVQRAGITQRVPLVATRRISRAVLFSCTSIESVSDAG